MLQRNKLNQFVKDECYTKMSDCDDKAKYKYNMKLNIDEYTWNDIYTLPFRVMVDNKLE